MSVEVVDGIGRPIICEKCNKPLIMSSRSNYTTCVCQEVNKNNMNISDQLRKKQPIRSQVSVNFKKLVPEAVEPKYAKPGDAGMDIVAVSKSIDEYGNIVYGTGLAFEIPEGYVMLLFPRSSNCKKQLLLTNSVGVVDSGFRGEVTFKFSDYKSWVKDHKSYGDEQEFEYHVGDRIGQAIILPYPMVVMNEVDQLSETERGAGGYGSTGR